jgi:hypothetical protein
MRSTTPLASPAVFSLVVVAATLAGCGALSNLGTITFDLPTQSFSFDTASSMWKAPPASFPSVSCGPGQAVTDCCNLPAPAPKPDCTATPLACENSVCVLEFPINQSQTINLKMQVPQLSSLSGQTLAKISISQVTYTIASTMNVDLPPVDVFIAPSNVMSASDPAAQKFGTIPASPAMKTTPGNMALDPNGGAVFSQYASAFSTPFNFIAHTTMIVKPGDPIPSGAVTATVTGKVSAKPNL